MQVMEIFYPALHLVHVDLLRNQERPAPFRAKILENNHLIFFRRAEPLILCPIVTLLSSTLFTLNPWLTGTSQSSVCFDLVHVRLLARI